MAVDLQLRIQYFDEIEKLEAKTPPLSEFEQKRLNHLKLAMKEMDEAGDMTFLITDPSGRQVVCKTSSVKLSDLDADGNFTGRKK
jgi:C4-type Zn-finger protein